MKINRQAKRAARQLVALCRVDGVLEQSRVRRAADHLATAGRRNGLAILSHFRRLVRLELAWRTATIESATPLPADLQASIESGLRSRYGRGLAIAVAHRPALIGGMRVQVGSDVYDGSVRARLAALTRRF